MSSCPAHPAVPGRRAGPPDRGSATVLGVAGLTLVVVVGLVAGAGVGTARLRQRAEAAADFGALAAATALARGAEGDAACRAAAMVTAADGARLTSCRTRGLEARVTVRVLRAPGGLPRPGARARAG